MNNETHTSPSETTAYHTTDPLPKAIGPKELMRALNVSQSTFYKFQREGKLKRFLLPRSIGNKKYSGRLVESYLNGGE